MNIVWRNAVTSGGRLGNHTLTLACQLEHVVDFMGADVHQSITPIISLVVTMNISQFPDLSSRQRVMNRLHGRSHASLMVHGNTDAYLLGFSYHLVGLVEVGTDGFFNFNIDTMF